MHERLHEANTRSHEALVQRRSASIDVMRDPESRVQAIQETDFFLLQLCQHLAAFCDVVLPATRQHLPEGRERVRTHVQHVRRLERHVRRTKHRLYGESHVAHLLWSDVWDDLGREFDLLMTCEDELLTDLSAQIDPETSRTYAARLTLVEATSPSRPHPNSLHTGWFAHASRSAWSKLDSFWNVAEGRLVGRASLITPQARSESSAYRRPA